MDQEETTSLWNKKMTDVTVGDSMKMNFLAPLAVVGGMFVGTLVVTGVHSLVGKFRKNKVDPGNEAE